MALRIWRGLRSAAFALTTAICAFGWGFAPSGAAAQTIKETKKNASNSAASASQSQSAPSKQDPSDSSYVFVFDQDLSQILKEFGRRKGIPVQVDGEIAVRVKKQKIPLEKTAFLSFIKNQYNVIAVEHEKAISFSLLSKNVSRMFLLNKNVSSNEVVSAAKAIGLDLRQYSMKFIPENNSLYMEAPPAILGQVAAIIESLAASHPGVTIVKYGSVTEAAHESTQNPK